MIFVTTAKGCMFSCAEVASAAVAVDTAAFCVCVAAKASEFSVLYCKSVLVLAFVPEPLVASRPDALALYIIAEFKIVCWCAPTLNFG